MRSFCRNHLSRCLHLLVLQVPMLLLVVPADALWIGGDVIKLDTAALTGEPIVVSTATCAPFHIGKPFATTSICRE